MINKNPSSTPTHQQMQQHKEWLENRSYEHHLNCIKRIKTRKNRDMTFSATYKNKTKKSSPQSKYDKKNTCLPRYRGAQEEKENCVHIFTKENRISTLQFEHELKSGDEGDQEAGLEQFQSGTKKMSHFGRENIVRGAKQTQNQEPTVGNKHQKTISTSRLQPIEQFNNHISSLSQEMRKPTNGFLEQSSKFSTKISLQQQELLWNNFLLGKRILETSPVISKRKHDHEYRKHKELLRSRTCRRSPNSNFRLKKLNEHQHSIQRIADDHRIENRINRKHMFILVIERIEILKYRFNSYENIILSMKTGGNNRSPEEQAVEGKKLLKKTTKQVSECISSGELTSHHFFFTLRRKAVEDNKPIVIEIKNVKSLNVLSAGTFSFQFDGRRSIESQEAKLFNFSKYIGSVWFSAQLGRKGDFLSNDS